MISCYFYSNLDLML